MVRKKNLYNPADDEPFKLSRSKIDLFLQCPRCFYLDRKLGINQPSGAPFTLNNAVDALLKREFDLYRELGTVHPFIQGQGIEAIPFSHPEIEAWRNNRIGLQFLHFPTNFLLTGAIDDVWKLPTGELVVVDYKAKATSKEITLEPKKKKNGEIVKTDRYLISYVNQLEFYQWLFRQNGFKVSNTGYFVFANAQTDRASFEDKLIFEKVLIPHDGDDSWVEPTLLKIKNCLNNDKVPDLTVDCQLCQFSDDVMNHIDEPAVIA